MTHFFHPEIFLDIARRIKDYSDLNEEGKHRVSIGRAYYAAFLTAKEYLKYRGREIRGRSQHRAVLNALDALNQEFIKNQLDSLRKSRVDADYHLNISINKELCEKCLIISEDIINSLEGI